MKKLVLLLGLMLMTMSAWADGHEESGPPVQIGNNFYYFFDDGAWLSFGAHEGFDGIWIRDTHCYSGNVVVPGSVNGVPVVGIMHDTFAECELTSLQLPSSIKYIGHDAFFSCSCPEVIIPSSVDTINYSAFNGCNFNKLVLQDSNKPLIFFNDPFGGYETDIVNEVYMGRDIVWNTNTCRFLTAKKATIGNMVSVLPNGLFSYNTNLESLTLGTGAKLLPQALCIGCHNLASVTIPEGVTHINVDAFNSCRALSTVSFPSTLKVIEGGAFYGNNSLTSLTIPASVETIYRNAFRSCPSIINCTFEDGTDPIVLEETDAWHGIFDESPLQRLHLGRKCIGGQLFKIRTLKSISFGDAIEEIPDAAFENCDSITGITWGNGLKRIGKSAFNGCKALFSIIIPEGVTHIGESAFRYCSGAIILSLPSTLKVIGNETFYYNTGLKSVSIPASVDSIGRLAFYDCNIKSFTLEDGEESIYLEWANSYPWSGIVDNSPLQRLHIGRNYTGGQTFKIRTLKSVSFGDAVDEIPEATFENCDSLTSIAWGNGLKIIGKNAFKGCKALTSVLIPKSVVEIRESAFANCFGMTTIKLSNGLKTIGATAFNNFAVTTLRIPATVENIGANAFGCNTVKKVYCYSKVPPVCENWVFYYNEPKTQATLYVPNGTENAYKEATCWKEFQNLYDEDLGIEVCDVNADGEVNIADLNNIISTILSGAINVIVYDVNDDGEINIADINVIIEQIISGN